MMFVEMADLVQPNNNSNSNTTIQKIGQVRVAQHLSREGFSLNNITYGNYIAKMTNIINTCSKVVKVKEPLMLYKPWIDDHNLRNLYKTQKFLV